MKDWETIYHENADKQFDNFHEVLMSSYNASFPEKLVKIRKQKKKYHNSKKIKTLKRMVDAANTIAYVSKDECKIRVYKMLKDTLKTEITNAVKSKNARRINKSTNTRKTMWDIIKEVTGRRKDSQTPDIVLDGDTLNSFFSSIGQKIQDTIKPNLAVSAGLLKNLKINTQRSMFMFPVTEKEIENVSKSLKDKNSMDIYGLSVSLLKNIIPQIKTPLTRIINDCFEQGLFPDKLKVATVKPIFKKGDPEKCDNYRPISILPAVSKIFEAILRNRLVDFLEGNGFLHPSQHGFRKRRSTVSAMISVLESIIEAYNAGEDVQLSCLDLSKAFDSVPHGSLLDKLQYYGVRGRVLEIFASYLANRRQRVDWDGSPSDFREIRAGVPQGSMLGPVLFILYINDLFANIESDNSCGFADDIALLNRSDDVPNIKSTKAITDAQIWFQANGLQININKTQNLTFSTKRQSDSTLTYLGITFHSSLCWNTYIDELGSKLSIAIFMIKRIKQISSVETARLAYFSTFHSRMIYGILIWGHGTALEKVLLKQKRAIRALYGMGQTESCRPVFQRERIMTVTSCFINTCLKYAHQNKMKFPSNSDFHSYNTRHKHHFSLPYSRINRAQQGANSVCLKLYNKLPETIKQLSEHKFNRRVRDLLLQETLYKVEEFLNLQL